MSLTSTLLKAGALYAVGRYASHIKPEDVEKVTGISGDDLKRYGLDRADALLGQIGLQRQATVPNTTALVLSGFAAGAIVGAGVTFLFYSEQGKDVRKKVAEYFMGGDDDEKAAEEPAKANGESKTVEA
ncbi:MAG: YtxH domain-containing protein [Sandaracinaceae bacterium]|nr:YtxH domain-containing protein [Sandaracinaceae bacterium]